MLILSIIPFEMVITEKGFKTNEEFCDENFVKNKVEFGKQRSPIRQSSNIELLKITTDSSITVTHLLQYRNNSLVKTEQKHLFMQIPFAQFSRKQLSIVTLLQ
jgi:hypothetical protein